MTDSIESLKAERDALREEVRQIARTRTADYAEYRAEVDALRAKLEAVTDDLEQIEEAMPENANGTDVVDFCKRMFAGDEALREKLAEAERQLSEVAAEWDAHAAIYKQAEARAVALAKERDEAITSLRLTQKARADDIGRLQQKCSDWGTYWRASDAHGVKLSVEQSVELLQDALGVEVEVLAATPPTEAAQPQDKCPKCGAVYRKAGSQWKCCDCVGEAGMVPAEDTKPTTLPKLPPGFYLASGDHDFHVAILGQVCWRTTAGAPRLDPRIEGYALTPLPLAAQPAQPARIVVKLPPTQTFVIHQQGGIEFTIAGKWLPVEGVLAALKAAGVEVEP